MRISTKTGDKGETSLFDGRRVAKDYELIDVLGGLDELQSFVGWCKFGGGEVGVSEENLAVLEKIQDDLYRMMGVFGFEMKCPPSINPICEEDVEFLEKAMGKHEEALRGLREFIRPGSCEAAARFHVARSVCRRVERDIVRICGDIEVPEAILKYVNRLSDLLFVFGYVLEKPNKL